MRSPFDPILDRQGFVLLDGGLGTALADAGVDLEDRLWSARALVQGKDALRRVHRAFLEAGSDVIATCTYQATVPGLMAADLTHTQARNAIEEAVQLAVEVRNETRPRALVAASIGPYGAFLADGSEYTGAYDLSDDELRQFHAERWAILAASDADIIACETIPTLQEARVLLRLAEESQSWVWMSFSCRDGDHLAEGTPASAAAALVRENPWAAAVGANCIRPEWAASLVSGFQASAKPVIVYPNSGESYDPTTKDWSGAAGADFANLAAGWRAAGAAVIGGCCRTTPETIAAMRLALR